MYLLKRVKSQTPESVELEFTLAGVGNRTHALIIDYTFWSLALFAILIGLGFIYWQTPWLQSPTIRPWFSAIQFLSLFAVYIGYFVTFETLWRGQTPGKRYVKIRVIREDGRNVGLQQSILRSLLRPLDDILFLGLILILLTPQEKRLGDWVAGTISIQEGQTLTDRQIQIGPAATDLAARMTEIGQIVALTPDEFATVRNYLYRYPALTPAAQMQVSDRLSQRLLEIIKIDESALNLDRGKNRQHAIVEAVYLAYQQQFRG